MGKWLRACLVLSSRKAFPHEPPLFPCILGRRTVLALGRVNRSISGEELKTAVRAGEQIS